MMFNYVVHTTILTEQRKYTNEFKKKYLTTTEGSACVWSFFTNAASFLKSV